ncbi:MAG: hypothetical protein K2M14_07395, partial [Muribaculaceae bacterium]|nr:hypothetical protein [Muribaculaceae bacterium]
PTLCFAASGMLTAKGSVQGLRISKGERWEVWCSSSKEQVDLQNWQTGVIIKCEKSGNMSKNGAYEYKAYIEGKHVGNIWIYVKANGESIYLVDIKTFSGSTRLE